MTEAESNALVASLPRNEREILLEMRRLGRASASDVRPVTIGPKTGKPLEYGLTRELNRLQAAGLARLVAKKPSALYEAVPAADVEKVAEQYRLKKKRTKTRRSPRRRLDELRTYEHGQYDEFYRVHRRVIELSDYVSHHIAKMAFWASAPKDELARVVDELADLRDAIDAALACLEQRTDDDAVLAKIAKLEETNGRTAPEAATARALAKKLRAQYDQRVGVLD